MHCKVQVQKIEESKNLLVLKLDSFWKQIRKKGCKVFMPFGIVVGIIFEKGQHFFMQLDEKMVQWYNEFAME